MDCDIRFWSWTVTLPVLLTAWERPLDLFIFEPNFRGCLTFRSTNLKVVCNVGLSFRIFVCSFLDYDDSYNWLCLCANSRLYCMQFCTAEAKYGNKQPRISDPCIMFCLIYLF